jgi:hypothetical protein
MARSESTTETRENEDGIITEIVQNTSTSDSDSIVLKRNAKGEVAWDIKAYGVIDNADQSAELRHRVTQLDLELVRQYHQATPLTKIH